MVFASKQQATDSKGKVKKGYKAVTDKNGKVRYLTESKPVKTNKVQQEKVAETKPKKEKKEKKEKKLDKGKEPMDQEVDESQFIVEGIET